MKRKKGQLFDDKKKLLSIRKTMKLPDYKDGDRNAYDWFCILDKKCYDHIGDLVKIKILMLLYLYITPISIHYLIYKYFS